MCFEALEASHGLIFGVHVCHGVTQKDINNSDVDFQFCLGDMGDFVFPYITMENPQ